jgi:predicted MFS family arabinose efflux permease
MLVFGLVMLMSFALVERFVAPRPFIPYRLLTDRTVLGACGVDFTYQIAYYCWYSYFTSFLQVVYSLSISQAGYVGSTFDVISGFWLLVVGYLIRRTGYFRWLLWIAVPLYLLGVGLMIYFRRPDQNVGLVIMCQVFIAFAGGTMIICQQVAVLSVASHNDAAGMLALLGVFGYVGGAIGNSISGAIWTNVFPSALQRLLPAESVEDWETIYEDLAVQLSYEKGTATRDAIIAAYSAAQSKMLIAGTAIMVLSLVWVAIIRNIKVSEIQQVKGMLF